MSRSRLMTARECIVEFFDASPQRVYSAAHLGGILATMQRTWQLAQDVTPHKFVEFLTGATPLKEVHLLFPNRPTLCYTWGEAGPYEMAMSLKPGGYLSHLSAMSLHDLAGPDIDTVYVDEEQFAKSAGSWRLTQESIDAAFRRPPRVSNNRADWEGMTLCILNGRSTGALGVVEHALPEGVVVRVMNLERTLIDITVRPAYAGGPAAVLEAYRRVAGRAAAARVAEMLERISYVYPYHQAVGLCLERSGGYSDTDLAPLKAIRHEGTMPKGLGAKVSCCLN